MNNFTPDDLLKISKHINQRNLHAVHLATKTKRAFISNRLFGTLGAWMIASGEKLQSLNAEALQKPQLNFSQNKTGKARA